MVKERFHPYSRTNKPNTSNKANNKALVESKNTNGANSNSSLPNMTSTSSSNSYLRNYLMNSGEDDDDDQIKISMF